MLHEDQARQLFIDYSPFVFQTALLLTKSQALADDITQETFLKMFQNYHTFDPSKPIKPWMYRITVNVTRNLLRKHKWLTFIGFTPEIAQKNTVELTILQDEQSEELYQEIDRLSQKSKEIIVLHFFAGLKLSEIAVALDIPVGTCKSRLNTALNQLRKQLSTSGTLIDPQGGNAYDTH